MRGTGCYSTSSVIGQRYLLEFLTEGLYELRAGVDINQNGKIDDGSCLPFKFSEPFKALADTIKVRKRWTTERVDITFQE
jgi:hypothetical protein